jgi:integrase
MAEVNRWNNDPRGFSRLTVKKFVDGAWRKYLQSSGMRFKSSTAGTRESVIKNHITGGALGARWLDEITPIDLTDYFADLRGKYEYATIANIYSLWKSVFDAAFDLDLISKIPLRPKAHRPKVARKKKPHLSADPLSAVFKHFPDRYKVLALVIGVTAARIGEILALHWQDFDEEKGQISISHTLYAATRQTPKALESIKTIEVPQVVVEALRIHRMKSDYTAPDDFIFTSRRGTPLRQDKLSIYGLRPALEAADIKREPYKHGFHLFRRSCAKLLYRRTHDPKLVQEYLRHAHISTTMDSYVGEDELVRGEATGLIAEMLDISLTVPQVSNAVN